MLDPNKILHDFTTTLKQQNAKGIAEYGQSLSRSNLSAVELLDYEHEEQVDSVQYNRVAKQRTLQAVALLKQNPPDVLGTIRLLEG